jgi:hypothetical protein
MRATYRTSQAEKCSTGRANVNELIALLRQLEAARFYGSVEVKFEAGKVTLIKRTETINPRARVASYSYREDRGQVHEHSGS